MPERDLGPLAGIEHIVVLMMENRSFDQMLGYLGRRGDVEGLGVAPHDHVNYDEDGTPYRAFPFPEHDTTFLLQGAGMFDKRLDPGHGPGSVRKQLETFHGQTPGGFVKNFIEEKDPPPERRGMVMGYYTDQHLPVYDFLANEFCVCDHWHASVPGDTWPNRQYALAGRAGPPVIPRLSLYQRAHKLLGRTWLGKKLKALGGAPLYDVPTFPRYLDQSDWRWYSHDPATLRGTDSRFRDLHPKRINRSNFAYFDRKKVSFLTEKLEYLTTESYDGSSFLDQAARGALPPVSWIDPNFIDLHVMDPNSNDDHPPADVKAGQSLVLDVYDALTHSPHWEDTLLVIVYDEHGGFYDHVVPPPVADDGSGYETLGVRVPALLVGPRVKKQHVCNTVFEHSTLVKTILARFAPEGSVDEAIAAMGARVGDAPDLREPLLDQPRTDVAGHQKLHEAMDRWRTEARSTRRPAGSPSKAPDGVGHDFADTDWQREFANMAVTLHTLGLPPGQP